MFSLFSQSCFYSCAFLTVTQNAQTYSNMHAHTQVTYVMSCVLCDLNFNS